MYVLRESRQNCEVSQFLWAHHVNLYMLATRHLPIIGSNFHCSFWCSHSSMVYIGGCSIGLHMNPQVQWAKWQWDCCTCNCARISMSISPPLYNYFCMCYYDHFWCSHSYSLQHFIKQAILFEFQIWFIKRTSWCFFTISVEATPLQVLLLHSTSFIRGVVEKFLMNWATTVLRFELSPPSAFTNPPSAPPVDTTPHNSGVAPLRVRI